MDQQELYDIAMNFRYAILKVKKKHGFHSRGDRMNNFPGGCCDDSADLFGYYLKNEYQLSSEQGNGTYRDRNPNNTTNHAFTIMPDGTVVDLTADQFPALSKYPNGVYVGFEIRFYRNLDRVPNYQHYDITRDKRLWHDYQAIIEYL